MEFRLDDEIICYTRPSADNYEFTMYSGNIEYSGFSNLKVLNFIENIQKYFEQSEIILERFGEYATLKLPIPFSKKVILVRLDRMEAEQKIKSISLEELKERIIRLELRMTNREKILGIRNKIKNE
jgi:hypothetical protein